MRVTGTARDFLKSLKPDSVGLIITDPPWRISGSGEFAKVAPYELVPIPEIVDDLKFALAALCKGGHAYIFAPAGPQLSEFMSLMERDWTFCRILVWEKGTTGLGAYQNCFEPVLVYSKGIQSSYRKNGQYRSLLKFDRPNTRTAKPWQLYKIFMEMSSDIGDLVVDPYCGTNPLEKACQNLPSRQWAANDIMSPEQIADYFSPGVSTTMEAAQFW